METPELIVKDLSNLVTPQEIELTLLYKMVQQHGRFVIQFSEPLNQVSTAVTATEYNNGFPAAVSEREILSPPIETANYFITFKSRFQESNNNSLWRKIGVIYQVVLSNSSSRT